MGMAKSNRKKSKRKNSAGRKNIVANVETKQLGFKAPATLVERLDQKVEEVRDNAPFGSDKKTYVDRSKLLRALTETVLDDAVDIYRDWAE